MGNETSQEGGGKRRKHTREHARQPYGARTALQHSSLHARALRLSPVWVSSAIDGDLHGQLARGIVDSWMLLVEAAVRPGNNPDAMRFTPGSREHLLMELAAELNLPVGPLEAGRTVPLVIIAKEEEGGGGAFRLQVTAPALARLQTLYHLQTLQSPWGLLTSYAEGYLEDLAHGWAVVTTTTTPPPPPPYALLQLSASERELPLFEVPTREEPTPIVILRRRHFSLRLRGRPVLPEAEGGTPVGAPRQQPFWDFEAWQRIVEILRKDLLPRDPAYCDGIRVVGVNPSPSGDPSGDWAEYAYMYVSATIAPWLLQQLHIIIVPEVY